MLDIIKKTTQIEGQDAITVRMYVDYTTSSGNVGKRTYRANNKYVIDQYLLAELTEQEELLGEQAWGHHSEGYRPEYEMVKITPNATRPISSDGIDTIYLEKGKQITIPSNLAVYLTETGQAA